MSKYNQQLTNTLRQDTITDIRIAAKEALLATLKIKHYNRLASSVAKHSPASRVDSCVKTVLRHIDIQERKLAGAKVTIKCEGEFLKYLKG